MSSSDPAEPDRNITAFFDTRDAAEEAIGKIVEAGLPRDKILLRAGAARKSGLVDDKKTLIQEVKDLVLPSGSSDASVEALRHEGFLLTVRPDAETHDGVLQLLERHKGLGVESRDDIWPEWKSDPGQNAVEPDPSDDACAASSAMSPEIPAGGPDDPVAAQDPGAPEAAGPERDHRAEETEVAPGESAPAPVAPAFPT